MMYQTIRGQGQVQTVQIQIRLLLLQQKAYRKQVLKCQSNLNSIQVLYFNIIFFSVLPVFIVLKHRQHQDSSGDKGCFDEDDKITSGYRSGMHDLDPCHLLKGLLLTL